MFERKAAEFVLSDRGISVKGGRERERGRAKCCGPTAGCCSAAVDLLYTVWRDKETEDAQFSTYMIHSNIQTDCATFYLQVNLVQKNKKKKLCVFLEFPRHRFSFISRYFQVVLILYD